MRVIITAPTVFEIAAIIKTLDTHGQKLSFSKYTYAGCDIEILVSGVGAVKSALSMAQLQMMGKIDLAIQVGLAGAYDRNIPLSNVVLVDKDRYGDLGVEERDGTFTSVESLGLEDSNLYPSVEGWIHHEVKADLTRYTLVNGLTVNTVSGTEATITSRQSQFNPQIETMEGAAFYYACRVLDIECVQVRAISNYVEPRNKDNWQIEEAIKNLELEFFRIFPTLSQAK